jgi:hypothetical protein
MKKIKIIGLLILITYNSFSQNTKLKDYYMQAFNEQVSMLEGKTDNSFKRAVFLTENAFHQDTLNYNVFCNTIDSISTILKNLIVKRGLSQYKTSGNWAIFTYMTDSLSINNNQPYVYDFDDFMGENDWTKMFTTKLIRTKKGNCHSLPYLYKIFSDEMGYESYLALAPNHVYIKHIDENGQWTNLELTSGGFPRDQWMIKQMAISVESIKNEIYMNPLSEKETIAMTIFDLSGAYEFQFGVDSFYLMMVEKALQYFPKSIPLLMNKANYYAKIGENEQNKLSPNIKMLKEIKNNYESTYEKIYRLGYKETPIELYEQWVKSIELEKTKTIQKQD